MRRRRCRRRPAPGQLGDLGPAGPPAPYEALARLQARLRAPEWEAALGAARRDGAGLEAGPGDGEAAER